jgi:hypothetical protein
MKRVERVATKNGGAEKCIAPSFFWSLADSDDNGAGHNQSGACGYSVVSFGLTHPFSHDNITDGEKNGTAHG